MLEEHHAGLICSKDIVNNDQLPINNSFWLLFKVACCRSSTDRHDAGVESRSKFQIINQILNDNDSISCVYCLKYVGFCCCVFLCPHGICLGCCFFACCFFVCCVCCCCCCCICRCCVWPCCFGCTLAAAGRIQLGGSGSPQPDDLSTTGTGSCHWNGPDRFRDDKDIDEDEHDDEDCCCGTGCS